MPPTREQALDAGPAVMQIRRVFGITLATDLPFANPLPDGVHSPTLTVYVVDRAPNQTVYEEDWVLYPNYQYPGPRFMGMMSVVPSPMEQPYASQSDFFRTVPFAAGSKFVRVTAEEFTSLPKSR